MRSGRPEVHHLIVGARVGQSFNKVEWVDDMASRDGEDGKGRWGVRQDVLRNDMCS